MRKAEGLGYKLSAGGAATGARRRQVARGRAARAVSSTKLPNRSRGEGEGASRATNKLLPHVEGATRDRFSRPRGKQRRMKIPGRLRVTGSTVCHAASSPAVTPSPMPAG